MTIPYEHFVFVDALELVVAAGGVAFLIWAIVFAIGAKRRDREDCRKAARYHEWIYSKYGQLTDEQLDALNNSKWRD